MKRTLSIIMATALAVLGVSCGGSGSPDAASPAGASPAASTQSSETPAVASQSSETPAVASQSSETPAVPLQPVSLAGTWSGSGVDSNANMGLKGGTTVTWTLTQTDASVSGTVTTQSVDPLDTSCASCHRNKTGTLSGTIAGTTLTLTMDFPAGNPHKNPVDVTPICSATLTATTSGITQSALTATYSGEDSCEGPLLDGTLTMARQP